MDLKIKKLTKTAIIPTRGSAGAAGFDLYADSVERALSTFKDSVLAAGGANLIVHTGIAMAIPKGYVGLIFARSGLACKKGLRPANCVGVIDEDYRGEIIVNLYHDIDYSKWYKNIDPKDLPEVKVNDFVEAYDEIKLHDRIAQIVFVKYDAFNLVECDDLEETERGAGGFGSTGK